MDMSEQPKSDQPLKSNVHTVRFNASDEMAWQRLRAAEPKLTFTDLVRWALKRYSATPVAPVPPPAPVKWCERTAEERAAALQELEGQKFDNLDNALDAYRRADASDPDDALDPQGPAPAPASDEHGAPRPEDQDMEFMGQQVNDADWDELVSQSSQPVTVVEAPTPVRRDKDEEDAELTELEKTNRVAWMTEKLMQLTGCEESAASEKVFAMVQKLGYVGACRRVSEKTQAA